MHQDLTVVQVDQIAADHEAHTNSLTVDLRRPMQLAKLGEQLVHLFGFYTATSVDNVHGERLTSLAKACYELNEPLAREFHRVFDEIDQDLLEPDVVSDEHARQRLVNALTERESGGIHVRNRLRHDLGLLHFGLGFEHGHDEVKQFLWVKSLHLLLKLALLDKLDVKDVIHEAEKQI